MKLYCAAYSPNCHKVLMTIAELGVGASVDMTPYDPRSPEHWFAGMHPGNKVPLLVDGPVTLAESGAINLYLAEKYGRLLPGDPQDRARCLHMLFFEASAVLPSVGAEGFFGEMMRPVEERDEAFLSRIGARIGDVLREFDGHLADERNYVAQTLSIADFQLYAPMNKLISAGVIPIPARVRAWADRVGALPSVRAVYQDLLA